MRATVDLPDPLLRRLKSQAALEGTTLKALVLRLVERGLDAPAPQQTGRSTRCALPTLRIRRPLQAPAFSNAALFDIADDA